MECTGMYYIVAVCLTVIVGVSGDTPANCSYEQILGTWEFKLGPGGNNNTLNCTDYDVLKTYTVSLYFSRHCLRPGWKQRFLDTHLQPGI
ncbi:hypothetical protein ScPMuIL_004251 [Solemya velum]